MKLLRDLFSDVSNEHWELGRFIAAWSTLSYSGAFLWAAIKGATIDWSSLGVGFAALLAGNGALIGIKDMARAKTIEGQSDAP